MLFAKISPTAKAAKQESALSVSIQDCNWMNARTEYVLGQANTRFQVSFGNFVTNQNPDEPAANLFEKLLTVYVDLSSEELSVWGEDDSVALEIIAVKLNTQILEIINISDIEFF